MGARTQTLCPGSFEPRKDGRCSVCGQPIGTLFNMERAARHTGALNK